MLSFFSFIIGNAAELMHEYDRAMTAYESALRHNAYSVAALSSIASLCRGREQFPKVIILFFFFLDYILK
jgi:hypothetical protein